MNEHRCSRWCGCTLEERFWAKVGRAGYAECWLWTKSTGSGGYGKFRLREGELEGEVPGMLVDAHRLAFRLLNGRWPDPRALHGCDNPPCCNALNPAHIHEGTQRDNVVEMWERGRGSRAHQPGGADHPRARFTAAQVVEFRRLRPEYPSTAEMARQLGVPYQTLSHVITGRRYG